MPVTLKVFATKLKKDLAAETFLVGGCVRDEILGRNSKDIDVVVRGAKIEKIEKILKLLNVRFSKVGKSFGVIKARFKEGKIDIALPRREASTGDGHKDFKIEFGRDVSLEEDAARRDFTINAIYKNVLTDEIFDPFGGTDDLEERILSITSNDSFKEDPLRILRAVQFCARFNLGLEAHTAKSMVENRERLQHISPERIALELEKLLTGARKPSIGLEIMLGTGILKIILPELEALAGVKQPAKHHNSYAFDHTLRVVNSVRPDLNMRFAALFHDLGKASTKEIINGQITFHGHEAESERLAEIIIDRLKLFSLEGFDREMVLTLIKNHMFSMEDKVSKPALRRLVRKIGGPDRFHDLCQLRIADKLGGAHPNTIWIHLEFLKKALDVVNEIPAPSVKDLKVDGKDVMTILNIPPGPRVGEVLKELFLAVENDKISNEREVLIARIEQIKAATEKERENGK